MKTYTYHVTCFQSRKGEKDTLGTYYITRGYKINSEERMQELINNIKEDYKYDGVAIVSLNLLNKKIKF